ncbi:MAG: hypothetical protein KTR30_23480 [Saprospiraceae bacterium]|nr:hypothetical protein [Saprospiraceae bacterium]
MKMRCVQDSIRLRLRKSEIEQLGKGVTIVEEVGFPGETPSLSFSLKMTDETAGIQAMFVGHQIQIIIPQPQATKWINSNQVGLETFLPLQNPKQLHVLIEKDFPCKDRENEDKNDLFGDLAEEEVKAC